MVQMIHEYNAVAVLNETIKHHRVDAASRWEPSTWWGVFCAGVCWHPHHHQKPVHCHSSPKPSRPWHQHCHAAFTHTHTHTFNGPLSRTTRVSPYQKGKTNLDFTGARDSGSGISWAICKSAPRSRQITTPAPHYSSFFTGRMPFQSNLPHCYGNSHAIQDHTVLPATQQRWHSRPYHCQSWYSIKRPQRNARLSWPSWLVT